MKKWTAAAIEELNIKETAMNFAGFWTDGGYTGDGNVGILTFEKDERKEYGANKPTPTPIPGGSTEGDTDFNS